MSDLIRIATRSSPLALWQANDVRDRLLANDPSATVELVPMTTKGDQWLDTSLAKLGGKGLFVKELESALLENRADLAVHSMKDVTAVLPEGLIISTVLEREDPYDAFVSNTCENLESLADDAIIGTCSVRRQSQLLAHRPSWQIHELRGNVNTRLAKLDEGQFDAIILASAGLKRLGFDDRIRHSLPVDLCLPAIGQGTIGIEIRANDRRLADRLASLHHPQSAQRLTAERALSASLNGGCSAPIAGHSTLDGSDLTLHGRVVALDGSTLLAHDVTGPASDAHAIGLAVAEHLRSQGAQALLDEAAARLALS